MMPTRECIAPGRRAEPREAVEAIARARGPESVPKEAGAREGIGGEGCRIAERVEEETKRSGGYRERELGRDERAARGASSMRGG